MKYNDADNARALLLRVMRHYLHNLFISGYFIGVDAADNYKFP